MKIAFLNIYNGLVERGAEVFVDEVASFLSNELDVTVFQAGKVENKKYNIFHIKRVPHTSLFYHFWVLIFTFKCLPFLWKEKYDWIIPVNGRFQTLICRLLRFLRGGKILISGHAGVGFDDRLNITLGKPDVFVALTPNAYSWAKEIGNNTRITYIPNGINIEKFNPKIKMAEVELRKPTILCVSALLPYKRIEFLIRAVSKLERVSLLIIGDGPLRDSINDLGNRLLNKRFKLISHIPHNEIGQYYMASKVFSLPSRESEAFGLVYLEAMACNIPVVAPKDLNRKEIIGNGGVLTGVENIEDYAKALDYALKTNFGDEPKKQAEKYSWNNIAKQYSDIFCKNRK